MAGNRCAADMNSGLTAPRHERVAVSVASLSCVDKKMKANSESVNNRA
jgi:hypothetical protein